MATLSLVSALLLLFLPGILTENGDTFPFELVVRNSLQETSNIIYRAEVVRRGVLLGAMRRLQETHTAFKFTYTESLDYGPYLESVNGLPGNPKDQTYWELLVETADGKLIRPDVGIGCYIPRDKEKIILNYTKW